MSDATNDAQQTTNAETTTVDALWTELRDAKAAGDHERVRAIENQMRDLGRTRRFAHLSDAELDARLASLAGERAPKDALGYSPGGGPGGDSNGTADLMGFNQSIRAGQHAGIEETRSALLDERARRQTARD